MASGTLTVEHAEGGSVGQTEEGPAARRYPSAWADHLLKTFPGVVRKSALATVRPHSQLHSMRRDEQGRFNDLEGGIPKMTEAFTRDLQRVVDAMIDAGEVANTTPRLPTAASLVETIDPYAIEAAIAALKVDKPRLWEILRFFQSPPALRQFDSPEAFARWGLEPPTDRSGLYRERRWAMYGVWERLPLAERDKVSGEA